MVTKRQFGEDEKDENPPEHTQQQNPRVKSPRVGYHMSPDAWSQQIAINLEPFFRRLVKEALEAVIPRLSSPRLAFTHQPEPSNSRGFQLHFVNKLPQKLYNNSRIKAEGDADVEIRLIDASTQDVIKHGPLASTKVEIVVLDSDFATDGREDWSEREFNTSILPSREGKRPLLVGNLLFSLSNGVGFFSKAMFTDNSSWVRSRRFRLGVRAFPGCSTGIGIREAISEAFVVLDHRGESYRKHNIPFLDDPVWRLKKISKGGASEKKLAEREIRTVRDFLQRYHIDPGFLRRVLGSGTSNKAWDMMVKHANRCRRDEKLYSYYNAAAGVVLLFDCVYKLIGMKFDDNNYLSPDTLDISFKGMVEELKHSAFKNLTELVPLDATSAACDSVSFLFQQNIPFVPPTMALQNGISFADQDEPEKELDFNQSETSASYPCTMEDVYQPGEDSTTAQSTHPMYWSDPSLCHFFMPTSFSEPTEINPAYDYFRNGSVSSFAPHNPSFDHDPFHPQNPNFHHGPTTWAQGQGSFAGPSSFGHVAMWSPPPGFGLNGPRGGRPRVRWLKIRAFLMWKIVKRYAAAKRKGKFPACYC